MTSSKINAAARFAQKRTFRNHADRSHVTKKPSGQNVASFMKKLIAGLVIQIN